MKHESCHRWSSNFFVRVPKCFPKKVRRSKSVGFDLVSDNPRFCNVVGSDFFSSKSESQSLVFSPMRVHSPRSVPFHLVYSLVKSTGAKGREWKLNRAGWRTEMGHCFFLGGQKGLARVSKSSLHDQTSRIRTFSRVFPLPRHPHLRIFVFLFFVIYVFVHPPSLYSYSSSSYSSSSS